MLVQIGESLGVIPMTITSIRSYKLVRSQDFRKPGNCAGAIACGSYPTAVG